MTPTEESPAPHPSPPRRKWRWIALGILLLGAASIPVARPAWRILKSWRADQFLQESKDLLAQQQISLAFERARSALQLVPTRPDVLRLNARLLTTVGSDGSLDLWQRLLGTGQATPDDRAAYIETALTLEHPELVGSFIHQFEKAERPVDRDLRLAALYYLQTSDSESALQCARTAHQIGPSNPTNSFLLARILVGTTNTAAHNEARDLLWAVAATSGPLHTESLRELTTGRPFRQDRTLSEKVRDSLLAIPARNMNEEILLAEAGMQLDPTRASEITSNLVLKLKPDDWSQLGLVVETLMRQRRPEDVLRLTEDGRSLMSRSLFLHRYEALVAVGKPAEAYRHLLSGNAPLQPFELYLLRARGAQETGNMDGRDGHLREFLEAAGENLGRLQRVAQVAEAGRTRAALAVAANAWKRIGDKPGQSTNALRHLQRIADLEGDTWTARDYARQAARLSPEDSGLRLDIAYYDLLLDENLEPALAEARAQLSQRTNDLFVRAVAALGHLKLGAADQAREVLDRFVVTGGVARPDAMAVVAATMGANGLEERARTLASRIPITGLRPEERELIREWLIPAPLGF